jgi:hypothetical protein
MTRQLYLRAIIDLYLAQPDTPAKAKRSDWAIAATFYQRKLPLEIVAHAIRLTTVRRFGRRGGDPLEPVHSLAYYRSALDSLPPDCLEPSFISLTAYRHSRLLAHLK